MPVPKQITSDTNSIAKFLSSAKSAADMKTNILALLTESEIGEFARRLEIVRLVKKGIPQHKIALQLGVGVATVTRAAREIRLGRFKQV